MAEEKRGEAIVGTASGIQDYEVLREGSEVTLSINAENLRYVPSVEDSDICMSDTIEKLASVKNVTRIVFFQKREFEYDYEQTQILVEVADLYRKLSREKEMFGFQAISDPSVGAIGNRWYNDVKRIIFGLLKSDPIGAYVDLKRMIRHENIRLLSLTDKNLVDASKKYVSVITYALNLLEKTRLITIAKPYIKGYKIGDRDVYRRIFSPTIKPDFMFTKLMSNYPENAEELANYNVGDAEVVIFKLPGSVQYLYHLMPPEFKLTEEKYNILDTARTIMAEHKPTHEEFTDPERMRQVFYNVGSDLIQELVEQRGLRLRAREIDELTSILVRYTIGFGLIEVLLQDEQIQDVSINSPLGQIPMYIVHGEFGDCVTNILPTKKEAESWASKLRMISGRPLDEANPLLDTEITLPGATSRVSATNPPLTPTGLAFSFRRHRDKPWTLPLFIKVGMISPLAAGLMSFLIDGTRTMMIAGTRSSGKSSLLGGLLIEIMRRYRIITIEDTFELPTIAMRKMGYNIQALKVASALARPGGGEVSATDGIRATLRLGDSALIVGEVRSTEAIALYEAMRIGASANVVAGTVHADSPYGVYDRVVNDIGVPKTSFKATDIIIVANPIKSGDGIHRVRRVTDITEVGKMWEEDPLIEGGFTTLFKYNVETDTLEPTPELINGESEVLKMVAGNIKELAGDWGAVWENIELRGKIKGELVKAAEETKDDDLLEAPFVIKSNDQFHLASELVQKETGTLDSKKIFFEWNEWFKREIKKRKVS
ncbi:type II/IV secretion system ATPase subunit [Candidatus Woesearchaeota archaeon]|nr:type II/IV secretion system ATPase subunit [Candidatus Woesearchaeota archaeon]